MATASTKNKRDEMKSKVVIKVLGETLLTGQILDVEQVAGCATIGNSATGLVDTEPFDEHMVITLSSEELYIDRDVCARKGCYRSGSHNGQE